MIPIRRGSHGIRGTLPGLLFFASFLSLHAEVKLAELFGDNMLLQRDAKAAVWGTADPGETITLTLADKKVNATADAGGKWKAVFQGLKANNGETMTVAGKSNSITVSNVAVGDVWICSGQSNMHYKLADKDEIAAANHPDIHFFGVPNVAAAEPASDVKGSWVVSTPATAGTFSAVAYYFAKNIQSQVGVPIGLISNPWGGMMIESFIPLDALESVPALKDRSDQALEKLKSLSSDAEKFPGDFKAWQEKVGRVDTENKGFAAKWADPSLDTKDWIKTTTPGDWSNVGVPNGGVVWLRKTVQVPPQAAGHDFKLNPGGIHDTDTVYFNGKQIGTGGTTSPYYWFENRSYLVPGRLIKAGENLVAIRIVSQSQKNPTLSRDPQLGFHAPDPQTVTPEWLAKVETEYPALTAGSPAMPMPPSARGETTPSGIYNAMVAPFTSYGIKGAIWYQGESNAFHPWPYRTFLPLLIKGWRDKWNIGDFPFYIVQLPNFGDPPTGPGQGDLRWAELREAEFMAWQKTPNTGMSVNIDLGEAKNIHPANKKDVGYRLSLVALASTYGQKIEYSGPVYDSMTVEGNKIRIKFTHLGGGLVAKDGPLKQFIICGADQKWAVGDAVIDGDSVAVSSPDVATPTTVRYAWANNPEGCNLYNKAGLPAVPFRTDNWPITLENRW